MLKFYKKAAAIFVGLIIFTLVAGYLCVKHTFLRDALLPSQKSVIPWSIATLSDAVQGGSSSIKVNDSIYTVDYTFTIVRNVEYPYASIRFNFSDYLDEQRYVDLSTYSTLSFNVRCSPHNVLSFLIYTFDENVTRHNEQETIHRVSSTFFSCEEEWQQIEIDLVHLEVPGWWLDTYKLEASNRGYLLDRVAGFGFGTSWQSPLDVPSSVKMSELVLHGRDWRFLYFPGVFVLIVWGVFAFWFFRQHTISLIADIQEKLRKDRPLVAYQQLSIEPQRDRDKNLILRFMATEYADGELSLDVMVTKLGVSRTKINDILKEELGYTFTAYLNKLRLTEAARLLSEKEEANVAEIAYSVGYKNVPYFNKLFKNEYGCTPKTFKNVYKQ